MEWIDLLRSMADISGARRPLARCGPAILTMIGWSGDLWGRVTGQEPPVNSAAVSMAWLPKNYSSARAATELGYSIRPAAETLRDAWDWFQGQQRQQPRSTTAVMHGDPS
jgi:hypothetical protein